MADGMMRDDEVVNRNRLVRAGECAAFRTAVTGRLGFQNEVAGGTLQR